MLRSLQLVHPRRDLRWDLRWRVEGGGFFSWVICACVSSEISMALVSSLLMVMSVLVFVILDYGEMGMKSAEVR